MAVQTDTVLGRASAGEGKMEQIACTAAGRALLDDASASAQRATLGLTGLANLAIPDSGSEAYLGDGGGTPAFVTGSGTYSPTRSNEANITGTVTIAQAQWQRMGKTVTVSGRFTADPTLTATATSFEMTLPVASNIGAAEDVAGVAFCGAISGQGAAISGIVANDTAIVEWVAGDITSQTWSFVFSYSIL